MNRSYKLKNQIPVLIVGCVLIIFFTMMFYGSHARSQTRESLVASGVGLEPGLIKSEALRNLGNRTSEELAKLDRIINDLKQRERAFRIERETLIQAISLMEKLPENALASASGGQTGRVSIEKVKRVIGGRPGKKDMMVGVVELGIVWKQIDSILDKLDEITDLLSERS